MKKGSWNRNNWNKKNRKSWSFVSKLLIPVFCMMFLFGGCSSEELENVDWESVGSELASLEEELAELESAYGEQENAHVDQSGSTAKDKLAERTDSLGESDEATEIEDKVVEDDEVTKQSTEEAKTSEREYEVVDEPVENNEHLNASIDREGSYTSMEDVALYLYTYDELPDNFMTKKEARELGWEGGSLEPYAPGMCIGGDYFGNYEGLLPEEKGRDYYECDIDTLGARSRGAKRIVYSDDGLIYYTDDHYESFTLLYGEE